MNCIPRLIAELEEAGIRLWVEGDRLCYDAPAGALTPVLREELVHRKPQIQEYLSGSLSQYADGQEPIPGQPRNQPLPLSYAQQRLWFLHRMAPDSPFYNVPTLVRLEGKLDRAALESSLSRLIERHETLRTAFIHGDPPEQRILPPQPVDLPFVDLSGLSSVQREAEADTIAAQEVRRIYNLSQPPLFRLRLLRLDTETHILVFTLHHIVFDGWSLGVLLRDLIEFYRATLDNRDPRLPQLAIQYADFAVWQRRWLEAGELERQLAYWSDRLRNAPTLELPLDHPRPPASSLRGQRLHTPVPARLAAAIRALNESEGATLFMTMLAAFNVLLFRYTEQEDLIIGTPIANRVHPQIADLIGFFANSLAIRTDLSGNPTFRELLDRVRSTALEAYEHQDLPFEKLVEDLNPDRDASRNPLFQVMFAVQNAPMPDLNAGALKLRLHLSETSASRVDLEVHVMEENGDISLFTLFDTALFEALSVQTLLDRYLILLQSIVSYPDRRILDLAWTTEAERREVLVEWNDTATPYPRDATIHGLFEEIAADAPNAPSLAFQGEQLSYGDLNARANQLARFLQSKGLKPGFVAGVCLERGFDLIAVLLSILKAGGAYLPLDSDYPVERLAFMLKDAASSIIITESALSDRLPLDCAEILCLDSIAPAIALEATSDLSPVTCAQDLAYLIYTSGSTGLPKGTAVEHRSVVRLVRNTNYIDVDPKDTLLQLAPVSFDASTFEIWGSLLNGALLEIFPSHTPSLEELAAFIQARNITTLWLTSALFHQMVDHHMPALLHVRRLLTGGDVVSPAHARKLLDHLPPTHVLLNCYGPTENTTFTTIHILRAGDDPGDSIPIGRPISNTRVYVLDPRLQPVPSGVPGELYIAGDGLARGYLNRPELDRERFLPDPFDTTRGGRLYKTGDRCRWRSNGVLEFLGRKDQQVKIRGFRVELGEIENVLREHPSVRDAVATVWESKSKDKRIAAYILAIEGQEARADALHDYLASRLPSFLLPASYTALDRFPLSPNGKVNRDALPDPAAVSATGTQHTAPRTPIEEILCGIWCELLGVKCVGIHDNFFSLGGHSLLAIRLAAHLHATFDLQVPLTTFFNKPTIAALALHIAEQLVIETGGPEASAREEV